MDRNTLIGFILIGALLITMFVLNSKDRLAYEANQKRIADSIAATLPKIDSLKLKQDDAKVDSVLNQSSQPFQITGAKEQLVTLENDVLKITFSTKGAQPKLVELKKYNTNNGKKVVIQSGEFNKIDYRFNVAPNQSEEITNVIFSASPLLVNADQSSSISFTAADSTGKKITHRYTVRPNNYMVDFDIDIDGTEKLFAQNNINFLWQVEANQIEKDHAYELTQSHICHLENDKYDFEYVGKGDSKTFKDKVDWLCFKQQFFITGLLAKNKLNGVTTTWQIPADSSTHYLTRATTTAQLSLNGLATHQSIPLQFYFGPSDYTILKQYGNQMENVVPLGSGIFAFVKYINRHFLLPVFDFLQKNIANMGIVILLLTLLIRLITSPILYKSYLSGAKMKVLKPEVDALREKFKDDQQTFGMEQMKLWKSAGVSPLGGCLPALLQIPIFMSLYYFFQSNISLRGKEFLWSHDLASYDSIAQLPFNIPFYGDHVSLFTLTAVATSLLISLYSMNNMQDNSNPMMKYMPYIFPFLLLGVFNKLPSALTWYYTVSNSITLILQIVIQKYIIDHDKIMMEIAENRKKPVKKSKMQERIEAMQESQKKLQDLKKKGS